jgi:hypothetical protein
MVRSRRSVLRSLALGLAAAHGRATTRAVHPVISRTVSRAAVADRLRMGFDKSPPAPLLALVAALAQQGRNSLIGRPPLCGPCGFPAIRNPTFRLPPASSSAEAALSPGSIEKSFHHGLTQKAGRPRKAHRSYCFRAEVTKKWRLRYNDVALQHRFASARRDAAQIRLRLSRPRAMTSAWISLVPSPIIISGASR